MTWTEISQLPPEEQHDLAILSRVYSKAAKRWRDESRDRKERQRKRKK